MQHLSLRPSRIMGEQQQRLIGVVSGLVLALVQFALFYLNGIYFHLDALTLIGLWLLLYFLAPIPLSFAVSRQTGMREDGWGAGGIIGCTAALLTTLAAGVYTLIMIISLPGSYLLLIPYFLFLVFVNIGAFMIAFAGAFVGSRSGIAGE